MNGGCGPLWLSNSGWRTGGIESVFGRTWGRFKWDCEDVYIYTKDLPLNRGTEPSQGEFRPWLGSVPSGGGQHQLSMSRKGVSREQGES